MSWCHVSEAYVRPVKAVRPVRLVMCPGSSVYCDVFSSTQICQASSMVHGPWPLRRAVGLGWAGGRVGEETKIPKIPGYLYFTQHCVPCRHVQTSQASVMMGNGAKVLGSGVCWVWHEKYEHGQGVSRASRASRGKGCGPNRETVRGSEARLENLMECRREVVPQL